MGIKAIALTATNVDNGVWAIEIQQEFEDGVFAEHPHSPFHLRVSPSYNAPVSITGLVLREVSDRILSR